MSQVSATAAYAARLPEIYRAILAAFPKIEPGRKSGYGLAFQTLAIHFANSELPYSLGDVEEACRHLAERGFIEIRNGIFAHPTERGEELIAAVTNTPRAPQTKVPPLPVPTW